MQALPKVLSGPVSDGGRGGGGLMIVLLTPVTARLVVAVSFVGMPFLAILFGALLFVRLAKLSKFELELPLQPTGTLHFESDDDASK